MDSLTYWKKREEEALKHYISDEKQYDREISRIYEDMLDGIQGEISTFYGKYAKSEGITIAEAKKRVSALDIAAYERKAKRYVRAAARDRAANGGKTNKNGFYFSQRANEEMKLYNLTMKVNRLEMLKANIGLEMIKGHAELETFMEEILEGRTMEELERQAGILGKSIKNNAQTAHSIVNASYKSATFSDRIWMYQDMMKADLGKLLQQGMIQGKNARVLARDIERYVVGNKRQPNDKKGAKYYAERLMRTEMARVQTEAQKQSFERNGFEQYKFIANSNCCEICKSLDGKVFNVKDMLPGENAAPVHPHCRCSTAAHSDRAEYEKWLEHLENGGTTEAYNGLKTKGSLTNIAKSAKMSGAFAGAYNNKNDPEGKKREAHAEQYYSSMRNSDKNDIVETISTNAEIGSNLVSKMYDHLIINRYNLDSGYSTFAPDYDISESIRRLREGKNIEKHDKILVYHEALEYDLMNKQGLDYEAAHEIANKTYNYQKALDEWLNEIEG